MRIGDWSSDVCSSDLGGFGRPPGAGSHPRPLQAGARHGRLSYSRSPCHAICWAAGLTVPPCPTSFAPLTPPRGTAATRDMSKESKGGSGSARRLLRRHHAQGGLPAGAVARTEDHYAHGGKRELAGEPSREGGYPHG